MRLLSAFLFFFSMINVHASALQDATLKTSIDRKESQFFFYDFYTYLETAPLEYEGENVFSAMTFRGEGIKVFLAKEENSIKAKIAGKDLLLARLETPVDALPEGYSSIAINSGVKVRLDHASLGKSYKIKVPYCLPGLPCLSRKIKVTPHRYKITIIGEDGDAFCIKRGFNRTAETDAQVDDQYSLGECLL